MTAPRKDILLIVECAVLSTLTLCCIGVQLERQIRLRKSIDASKGLLIAAAVLALSVSALLITAAVKGLGTRMPAEQFYHDRTLQKLVLACFPPYFLCNMLVKVSWLTFYYCLACSPRETWIIHGLQVIAVGFGISSFVVAVLLCAWENPQDHVNILTFLLSNTSMMLAIDTTLYILPMWLVYKNTVLRQKQWAIYCLFGLGLIIVVVSSLRLVAYKTYSSARTTSSASPDFTMILFWGVMENHLGICVACAGAVKHKFIDGVSSIKSTISSTRHSISRRSGDNLHSHATQNSISKGSRRAMSNADSLSVPRESRRPSHVKQWYDVGETQFNESKSELAEPYV